MNVLVTGGNGQLGISLHRYAFDDEENIWHFADHKEFDITNELMMEDFVVKNNVQFIVNCAAYTNVPGAEFDQMTYIINGDGCRNLANICKRYNIPLIHISTDYVYGGTKLNKPINEKAPLHPENKYGGSKMLGEQYIKTIAPQFIILRTQWLYSIYGKNFFLTIINKLKENTEFHVVYDQVGTPTYADDLAQAIVYIVKNKKYLKKYNGIYNFSNLGVASWYDFAKYIENHTTRTDLVKPGLTGDGGVVRPVYTVMDKTKFTQKFGFDIPYWTNSLDHCIETYKRQR